MKYIMKDSEIQMLKNELLATLSFWDFMGLEHIYLDLNETFLLQHPHLTIDSLFQVLKELQKEQKVCCQKSGEKLMWKKNFPKRKTSIRRALDKLF